MSFDWQTEEESRWEKTGSTAEETPPEPQRRWPWLILLLAVALVGVYFGWRMVQDRVAEATELVQADVRSSHRLARQAARDRDQELFVTLLSGRSQSWTEAQKERLEQGLLFADTGRLFGWQPLEDEGRESDVTLNADLTEAVLVAQEPFEVRGRGNVTGTVTLSQTAVYRQGSQRWLLSPPDSEFWGEWRTTTGELLRVVYPQRDEELVLRLAEDIDAVLEELCLTMVTCPPRLTMRLRLESDPRSVLLAGQPEAIFSADNELTLPAPTLVGYPADEASYDALVHGYAGFVVTGMLLDTAGYECCDHVLFQQAIVALQLAELGLRPPPVTSDDYVRVIDARLSLERLSALWDSVTAVDNAASVPIEVYTYLEFLRQQATTPDNALREFQLAVADDLQFYYMGRFTGYESGSSEALEQDWREFAREQLLRAQEAASLPPGLSLPEQDLVALCGGDALNVYRYSLRDGSWQTVLEPGFGFGILATTPGDDGFFVTGTRAVEGEAENIDTWYANNDGTTFPVGIDEREALVVFPWQVARPADGRMFAWLLDREGQNTPDSVLIEPQNCSREGCRYEEVTGLPVHAPDGGAVLYEELEDMQIFLQREGQTSLEALGQGNIMTWLDEENFLLVRPATAGRGQGLFVATGEEPQGRELVDTDALNQAISSPSPVTYPLRIVWAGADPDDPQQIVIIASLEPPAWQSHIFVLTRPASQSWLEADPELRWLHSAAGTVSNVGLPQPLQFVSGRWLVLPTQSEYAESSGLLMYDLQEKRVVLESQVGTGEVVWGQFGDWSADGQWFARSLAGGMDLIAPAFTTETGPFRYIVPHEFERCQGLAWMNP